MNWFRWYHSTTTDPKLALVAHLSGQSIPLVIAVWAALLESASQSVPRGSIASFDPESYAVTFQTSHENIQKVMDMMAVKQLVMAGQIGKWGIRQCDPTAAERQRKCRENKRSSVTPVTAVTVTPVTSRNVTPEEKRIDKTYIGHFPNAQEIFEKCWAEYPRREKRKAAEKHFFASVKSVDEARELFSAIQNYKAQTVGKEIQYIQQGGTFFNNWRDYADAHSDF